MAALLNWIKAALEIIGNFGRRHSITGPYENPELTSLPDIHSQPDEDDTSRNDHQASKEQRRDLTARTTPPEELQILNATQEPDQPRLPNAGLSTPRPIPGRQTDQDSFFDGSISDIHPNEFGSHRALHTETENSAHLNSTHIPDLVEDQARLRARQRLDDSFNVLSNKRMDVLAMRLEARENRSSLRREREASNDLDSGFLQSLRSYVANEKSTDIASLFKMYDIFQETRDKLQSMEDDYNKLEDQLNRAEWELKELEGKLYQRIVSAQISIFDNNDLGVLEKFDDTASAASPSNGPIDYTTKRNRYLSRVGDASLIKERLMELRIERAQIVEEEMLRNNLGILLDEESREFLFTFDARQEELMQELAHVEEDVSRMKDALNDNEDFLFSLSQFQNDEEWDQISLESASMSEPHPLLLDGSERSAIFSNSAFDTEDGIMSSALYINQWLLHRLRRSSLEVRRFKSVDELRNLKLDQDRLKDLVLEWWCKDETSESYAKSRLLAAKTLDSQKSVGQEPSLKLEARSDSFLPTILQSAMRLRRRMSLSARNMAKLTLGNNIHALARGNQTPYASL